jgi:hypothetical protein
MSYRNTASFGKRQEFIAISELLKRGFDVYLTLVDDQGIDCVIKINENLYLDIQIKTRSKIAKNSNHFGPYDINPWENYFYILYMEETNNYFVLPTYILIDIFRDNKSGKNIGKFSLKIPKTNKSSKHEILEKYKNENGFNILSEIKDSGKIKKIIDK